MRLIDADKIVNYEVETEMSIDKDNSGRTRFVLLPVEHLSDIPTDDMAMQAVEKQIPKKIIYHDGNYDCSVCGKPALAVSARKKKFCDFCGQKHDWNI